MTKLEEKLLKLGYKKCHSRDYNFEGLTSYLKLIPNNHIVIFVNKESGCIDYHKVIPFHDFQIQEDIDNLQQAFNEMQKDLEVLKEYER